MRSLVHHDRTPAVTLSLACAAALVWANAAGGSYGRAWGSAVTFLGVSMTWRGWIDEGVMLGFFGLIGLEIRREVIVGELRHWRRAVTPVLAALGGMAVPGAFYAFGLSGRPGGHGWGIPVATDVAFSLSALALFGGKGSARSRVFLMTLAVADDIFTVVLLVVAYSGRVASGWLALGLSCLAVMGVLAWLRRMSGLPSPLRRVSGLPSRLRRMPRLPSWLGSGPLQVAFGLVAWWALLHAGVEAAVAGVAIGALAPRSHTPGDHLLGAGTRAWELRLTPVVNLVVLPLFALANSGVGLAGAGLEHSTELRIFVVVLVARVVAKPAGIYLTTEAIGVLARSSERAGRRGAVDGSALARIGRPRLAGLSATASIGFTVPLLIVRAALPAGAEQGAAIVALLAGSVAGAGVSAATLLPERHRTGRPGRVDNTQNTDRTELAGRNVRNVR